MTIVSIDANVPIYLYDPRPESAAKRQRAQALVPRLALGLVVTPAQVHAELINVLERKFRLGRAEAVFASRQLRAVTSIAFLDEATLDDALSAHREHGLSIFDAQIWATVRRAGCTHLLTEDFQDGRTLGGVTFVNPFQPANADLLELLLPVA